MVADWRSNNQLLGVWKGEGGVAYMIHPLLRRLFFFLLRFIIAVVSTLLVLSCTLLLTTHMDQVNRPKTPLCQLGGHHKEVTSVAWSYGDLGKVATCSDDGSVKVWRVDRHRPSGLDVDTGRKNSCSIVFRGIVCEGSLPHPIPKSGGLLPCRALDWVLV